MTPALSAFEFCAPATPPAATPPARSEASVELSNEFGSFGVRLRSRYLLRAAGVLEVEPRRLRVGPW